MARRLTEKAKKLSKRELVRHFATFMETEVYASLMAEVREKGALPTNGEQIASLLESARDQAVEKFDEAMTIET